jgi:hypothetical protein
MQNTRLEIIKFLFTYTVEKPLQWIFKQLKKLFMKKVIPFLLSILLLACGGAKKEPYPTSFENAKDFEGLELSNVKDKYNGINGQYEVTFTVTNNSKVSYDILQVDGKFYHQTEALDGALTGDALAAGESKNFKLTSLLPDFKKEPTKIVLSINKDASFVKK